jgi:hypothetical protein
VIGVAGGLTALRALTSKILQPGIQAGGGERQARLSLRDLLELHIRVRQHLAITPIQAGLNSRKETFGRGNKRDALQSSGATCQRSLSSPASTKPTKSWDY